MPSIFKIRQCTLPVLGIEPFKSSDSSPRLLRRANYWPIGSLAVRAARDRLPVSSNSEEHADPVGSWYLGAVIRRESPVCEAVYRCYRNVPVEEFVPVEPVAAVPPGATVGTCALSAHAAPTPNLGSSPKIEFLTGDEARIRPYIECIGPWAYFN
jgi:hypothetical protein